MNISTTTILNAINQSRASQGFPPLKFNTTLSTFAQNKANDMIQKNYFSHHSPDGKSYADFIDPNQYNYNYAGENLAVNFTDPQALQDAWMNSPLHRANILNKNYRDVGIATDGDFVVTFFGNTPNQQASPPKPTSTKPTVPKPVTIPRPPPTKNRPIQSRNPMKYVA